MVSGDCFSNSAQKKIYDRAVMLAGSRYNSDLNIRVDAPIEQLDIAVHASSFLMQIKDVYEELCAFTKSKYVDSVGGDALEKINSAIEKFVDKFPLNECNWDQAKKEAEIIREKCYKQLVEIGKQNKVTTQDGNNWARRQYHESLLSILYRLDDLMDEEKRRLYNRRIAILCGEGGIGKTHALCDYAGERLANNLPTFMFLSDDLCGRDPVVAISRKFNFKSKKIFLEELQKFASQQSAQICFIVDAVNENPRIKWRKISDLLSIPNLSVILSLRSGFEAIAGVSGWDVPRIWHYGLTGGSVEWEAMQKYFQYYGLKDVLDTPVLYEEFRNPLFLKIFCESYAGGRDYKRPRGHMMTNIFEQYVAKKTKTIEKDLGIFLGKKTLWNKVVKPMAEYLGNQGNKSVVSYNRLKNIILKNMEGLAVSPGNLIESMCRNGILHKSGHYTKKYKRRGYDYGFAYHRFSDHVIVRYFLNSLDGLSMDDASNALTRGALFKGALKYGNMGIIEALAIQYPERYKGQELVTIIPKRYRFSDAVWTAALNSVVWRNAEIKDGKYLNIAPEIFERYMSECINCEEGCLII